MATKKVTRRTRSPASAAAVPTTRTLTIVARDPSVVRRGGVLLARVAVPYETLAPGPVGHRLRVVDVDTATGLVYRPHPEPNGEDPFRSWYADPGKDRTKLLADPRFHQQNVYAIAMRTLALFERALGRRVAWGFEGHQLHIAPHAFVDANAYYSRAQESLMFGYFPVPAKGAPRRRARGRPEHVYLCLSHDVVAHEATHALVDGLRPFYQDPSSADQAAFHEAFADVVALLSFFSLSEITGALLDDVGRGPRVSARELTVERLRRSVLFAMGKEVAEATDGRGRVLRRSVELPPSRRLLERPEFQEPHRRGEVLVAAMLDAFLTTWAARARDIVDTRTGTVSRDRAVEDGALAAERLLQGAIRALDYAPPVDLELGDFLSALLTADREIQPDGEQRRELLRARFAAYGIDPATESGYWDPPPHATRLEGMYFDALQRDPQEVFRFLWENRERGALDLDPAADTRVTSVRPCVRIATDGFVLRETVAEYVQTLELRADELPEGLRPRSVPPDLRVTLHGGGTLLFDQFGKLKFHVQNRITSSRQRERIAYLWSAGGVGDRESLRASISFSDLHRRRAAAGPALPNVRLPRSARAG